MADSRTFTLIGEFKDGITPELAKINKQLATLKAGFSGIGSRKNTGFRGATNDIGKLISAHKNLSASIKDVGSDLRSTIGVLQQYRREMGKAASATRSFQKSGGNLGSDAFAKNMRRANAEAQAYLRTLQQINRQSPRTVRMPTGGGGGGAGGRRPQTGFQAAGGGGYDPGRSAGGGMGAHMAEFGFAFTLGNALAQPIQNAVVSGFQIGIGLMTKPFQYFVGAFGERIQDEISDLKSAGGLFSISKRSENPFLKNIDEAIQFQQDTNKTFAKMAATLPGVTNDYVQVGKRLSDTAARIVNTDFAKAKAEAERIRSTEEGRKFYGGAITGSAADQQKEVIKTLLGELTKKTTIAGMGGRSGAGGIAGAYGLPGLTERMLSQQEVTMGQFQRYAAVFSDPTIADALQRNIDKINATQMNSVDRFKAIQKLLDEVVTPDLIEKLRISVDGVYQGMKSAFLDPDTGLFGLGREFKGIGKRLNAYGQYVNEAGQVVTDLANAASEDLSIFEILRDIFSNAGQALMPIVEVLPQIFDPLNKVAKTLMDARHYAAQFNMMFNRYREGLKVLSEQKGNEFLKGTIDVRASMMAITNILKQVGAIDSGEFQSISKQLGSKDLNIGKMLGTLIDKVLNSDIAGNIGETIGTVIGTVLSEVSKVTGFLSGRLKGSSKLFEGLKKGFEEAGGREAFKNIFQDVFKSMFKVLLEVMKIIPFEGYMLMAAMVVIPAAIQGLGMLIAEKLLAGLLLLKGKTGAMITKSFQKAAATTTKGSVKASVAASAGAAGLTTGISNAAFRPVGPKPPKGFKHIALPGNAPPMTGGVTGPYKAPELRKPPKTLTKPSFGMLSKLKGKGAGMIASGMIALSTEAPALAKAGQSLMAIGKSIPVLNLAFGALDFGLRKAGGQDTAAAAGGAAGGVAGGVLGGAIGTAIAPGIGTAIGSVLGTMIGGWIGENIAPFFASLPAKLSAAWQGVSQWFSTLPNKIGYVLGYLSVAIPQKLSELGQAIQSGVTQLGTWITKAIAWVGQKMRELGQGILAAIRLALNPAQAIAVISSIFGQIGTAIRNAASNWWSQFTSGFSAGQAAAKNPPPGKAKAKGEPGVSFGSLGAAAAYEMKHKPAGSDLVIANSSETVIPAAGGNGGGMVAFVETLRAGFEAVVGTYRQTSQQAQTHLTSQMTALGVTFKDAQEKQRAETAKITQTLVANQQQTNARFAALEKKMNTPSIPGGLGGAAAGGVDAFTPIAARMGLQLTSGYRPGDDGWHGVNRARDYSNSTGPTPQMMQFAQYMAATYGSNLKELIYTPLGFSIKNGQRVAPLAQGSHYNHVHVAYAMGLGNGVAFSSLAGAQDWERSMVSGSVKVGSVTGNSAEGFGGGTTVTNNITINQQPGQNADELASIVAMKIGEAVADARAASIFV